MENLADSYVSFLLLSLKEFYLLKANKRTNKLTANRYVYRFCSGVRVMYLLQGSKGSAQQ